MITKIAKIINNLLVGGLDKDTISVAIKYLAHYGYIKSLSEEDVNFGIKIYQERSNLLSDGIIGPKTFSAMNTPRCGCPDLINKDNPQHIQYLELLEFAKSKWNKSKLLFYVDSYVDGISKNTQIEIFHQAWESWEEHCNLSIDFTNSIASADLVISTGSGRNDNFDGPGGTLAWAYLPSGDRRLLMKFDLGETWIINPAERGILLLNVAAHEFGHMLGLDHSSSSTALMAPYYKSTISKPQSNDDIPRIQALYGKKTNNTPTNPPSVAQEYKLTIKGNLKIEGYELFKTNN